MSARPIYFDCDTGVDDALALAYLIASDKAQLRGIGTVSGNTDSTTAARNTLDLLQLAGVTNVPVAIGERDFMTRSYDGGAPHVHGANGIGNIVLPESTTKPSAESAVDLLLRLAHETEGKLHLIAVGPLTNIARALEREPRLPELVDGITIMGGAAEVPGNITPVAEANIANDPEAAAAVFSAGWTVTMVPLDVTMTQVLEAEDRERLAASGTEFEQALAQMLGHYFEFYREIYGRACCAMHDPLAVAVALGDVEITSAPLVRAQVDTTNGPGRGQTICDLRAKYRGYPDQSRANCRPVLGITGDFPSQLTQLLLEPTAQVLS
ncbi:nucleoside hydrolase [Glutamicibacter endophyticus]|uniref:nucleoside hydrolase n=1 Tax=Glutamicibacter endophyticus TaxID=1522174 RepID=UPI003AF019B6